MAIECHRNSWFTHKNGDFPQLWMTIPWSSLDHVGHQVLVDDEPPPCALLTYVELTNSGGRILRGGGIFGWTGWLGEMGLQHASTMKGFRSQLKFLLQDRIPQVSVRMVFGYQGGPWDWTGILLKFGNEIPRPWPARDMRQKFRYKYMLWDTPKNLWFSAGSIHSGGPYWNTKHMRVWNFI